MRISGGGGGGAQLSALDGERVGRVLRRAVCGLGGNETRLCACVCARAACVCVCACVREQTLKKAQTMRNAMRKEK